jgi:D-alanyl-D-alanine carboxypeptidase
VDFAPGAGWEYSNTNYILLGMIAERVASRPLEQLIRERILAPLGALFTFLDGRESAPGPIAKGNTGFSCNPSAAWSAGALKGTLADLASFTEARSSGKLHSAAANAVLFDTTPTTYAGVRYGGGLMEMDASLTHGGGKAFGHTGAIWGYHSAAFYYPDRKTTVALVVDDDRGPGGGYPLSGAYDQPMFDAVETALFGGP